MSALAGARILIPRAGSWGMRVQRELAALGAEGVIAPLIESQPPLNTAERDRVFAGIARGDYDWVFVTSAASVDQLRQHSVQFPAASKLAVVGAATEQAAVAAGLRVDFVPSGQSSARSMIAQWCAAHPAEAAVRCLVLRSDLAAATVSDALELGGYRVEVCVAYRTVGVDLPEHSINELRHGRFDAVLLTSASVARELVAQLGLDRANGKRSELQAAQLLPATTILVSMGPRTTREAERLGLRPQLTSMVQSVAGMIETLAQHRSQLDGAAASPAPPVSPVAPASRTTPATALKA